MREANKRFRPGCHLEARIDMAGIVTVYMHQTGRPTHIFRGGIAQAIAGLLAARSAIDKINQENRQRQPIGSDRHWLN